MMSLKDIILLIRSMQPIEAARLFAWSGILNIAVASIFIILPSTDLSTLTVSATGVPAVLTSKTETWDRDRSIYRFHVTYRDPEGNKLRHSVYAYKITFDTARINKNTRLLVDVGYLRSEPMIVRLYTENETLYDKSTRQMIYDENDRLGVAAMTIFGTMGSGFMVGACFMYWRHYRSELSTCKDIA
ncbi:hypothetical protein [Pseudomonas sp. UBA6562]|uniref:hypothetical protein n=1 Tax=Pseudomonas sp. UBA6562 TaxID=1947332 RepID=UPI0025D1B20C|nr:hypothetical protein [Pseudomonas sp. UBA6562]